MSRDVVRIVLILRQRTRAKGGLETVSRSGPRHPHYRVTNSYDANQLTLAEMTDKENVIPILITIGI